MNPPSMTALVLLAATSCAEPAPGAPSAESALAAAAEPPGVMSTCDPAPSLSLDSVLDRLESGFVLVELGAPTGDVEWVESRMSTGTLRMPYVAHAVALENLVPRAAEPPRVVWRAEREAAVFVDESGARFEAAGETADLAGPVLCFQHAGRWVVVESLGRNGSGTGIRVGDTDIGFDELEAALGARGGAR